VSTAASSPKKIAIKLTHVMKNEDKNNALTRHVSYLKKLDKAKSNRKVAKRKDTFVEDVLSHLGQSPAKEDDLKRAIGALKKQIELLHRQSASLRGDDFETILSRQTELHCLPQHRFFDNEKSEEGKP